METKHTPGPWEIAPFVDGDEVVNVVKDYQKMPNGASAHWIAALDADLDFDSDCDEMYANAQLIAAAPDLLAACKMVASFAQSWQPLTPGDIRVMLDAIAKAEGAPTGGSLGTPTGTPDTGCGYAPYWLVALCAAADAIERHDLWCGHKKGSPGDASFNRAERLVGNAIRRAVAESEAQHDTGDSSLGKVPDNTMPPLEPGDWVHWGVLMSRLIPDSQSPRHGEIGVGAVREMHDSAGMAIHEIRKANGKVWRRDAQDT